MEPGKKDQEQIPIGIPETWWALIKTAESVKTKLEPLDLASQPEWWVR